jgi:hypothetical protein
MDLTGYVDTLRRELGVAARAAGPDAEELADRLTAPLEAATRLVLQEAVSDAAEEISRELAPGSVDVRLRGRDLGFVVTPTPQDRTTSAPIPPVAPRSPESTRDSAEGGTARLTVRLMDQLKAEVEAAADREGLSVNAFLVRMLAAAVQSGSSTPRHPGDSGTRISGWVQ